MKFAVVFVSLAFTCAVSAAGPKAQYPSCYALDQPSDLPGQKQPDIDCEKCQVEAKIQQVLTGKAAYIPQCNVRTNQFLPKQCDTSTGFCWCSSLYGIEIPNTKTKKKGLVCKKKAKKGHNCSTRAATKGFTPKCNGKDFHKVQCMASGFCWCSMKDGFLVPNTIHKKNLKKTPLNCAAYTDLKFKCGKRLGNFKHPFDLTRYLKCGAGGKAYACSCPAKTIFHPKKQICLGFSHYNLVNSVSLSGKFVFSAGKKNWSDARAECRRRRGDLAMHLTEQIMQFLWAHVIPSDVLFGVWIGGFLKSNVMNWRSSFQWVDGYPISVKNGNWWQINSTVSEPTSLSMKCMQMWRGPLKRKGGKYGPVYLTFSCTDVSDFLCYIP